MASLEPLEPTDALERCDEGNLNNVSLKTQMDTLRVFSRWRETIDAVPIDLSAKVRSPTLTDGENQRDVRLDSETAAAVLVHLGKYEWNHLSLFLRRQLFSKTHSVVRD